jgi:hypothetical protein
MTQRGSRSDTGGSSLRRKVDYPKLIPTLPRKSGIREH